MSWRRLRNGAMLCLVLGACTAVGAVESSITIDSASLKPPREGAAHTTWRLDADAEIELNRAMRAGLDNGVPLHFVVQFEIRERRNFWPDSVLLRHRQRYSVIYYELTKHYRVQTNMPTGSRDVIDTRNYRSLLPALDGLGRLRGLPIEISPALALRVNSEKTQPQRPLIASLSIKLDGGALPLPLQPLVSSTWRMASEDYTWPFH